MLSICFASDNILYAYFNTILHAALYALVLVCKYIGETLPLVLRSTKGMRTVHRNNLID
jgi:hypothetical protein